VVMALGFIMSGGERWSYYFEDILVSEEWLAQQL
jgi:hypothetical protein